MIRTIIQQASEQDHISLAHWAIKHPQLSVGNVVEWLKSVKYVVGAKRYTARDVKHIMIGIESVVAPRVTETPAEHITAAS